MDSSQALSHVVALVSKPLVPNLHPKAELAAHIRALPPEATASDVAFIAVLWAFTGPTGEAYPGQERIAREARMGVRPVREVSQRLERAGRIARRLPAPSIRPSRKTTRYQLAPLAPGPRAVRTVSHPSLPRTGEAPAQENTPAPTPQLQRQQPPPAEQEHRQPPPVPHRQPPPVKSSNEINQSQSARAPVVPQAETLAARLTAPATARGPAAAPPPPPAPRANAKPDTAAALATLRAWTPPAKQLQLPLESTKGIESKGDTGPTAPSEPRGS